MGCCGSHEEPVLFLRPDPIESADYERIYSDGEKLDQQTLVARVHEMIVNEPGEAKHRLAYALLMSKTGKKKTREEMEELFRNAQQTNANWAKVYSCWGYYLASLGATEDAGKKYQEGYEVVYAMGRGRMLDADDVELLGLYAAHGEEHGLALPLPAGDIWKDCALRAPENATAQGNYALYLLRHNDRAGAQTRLQKAAASGDEFWTEQYNKNFS